MRKSKIAGVGHYVPDRVVTNQDLEKIMDTSNEWIVERPEFRNGVILRKVPIPLPIWVPKPRKKH